MALDVLEQFPTRSISANELWIRVKEDAVLVPLYHQWGTIQAYRVDAHGGPYLMRIDQVDDYRAKCTPKPPKP